MQTQSKKKKRGKCGKQNLGNRAVYLNQLYCTWPPTIIPCEPFFVCRTMQGLICDMYNSLFSSSFFIFTHTPVVLACVVPCSGRGAHEDGTGTGTGKEPCDLCCRYPAETRQLFGETKRKARVAPPASCAYFSCSVPCECRPRKDLLGMPGHGTMIISVARSLTVLLWVW
jgi:hypothetical protein